MKKILGRIQGAALVALAAAVLAGCADGGFKFADQEFNIAPPKPVIISFYADPDEVNSGESTTIYWEVAGADDVEIKAVSTGTPIGFHVETDELSGSAVAANLTATTDFTLTASKSLMTEEREGEGEESGEPKEMKAFALGSDADASGTVGPDAAPEGEGAAATSVSQTITVTVIQVSEFTAEIWADDESIAEGESTIIRWRVTPPEGASVAVSASTGEPIEATDECGADEESIMESAAEDLEMASVPPEGCAVVTPVETTVYSIEATSGEGESAQDSVEVAVEESALSAVIFLNDNKKTVTASSFPEDVEVSWTATPAAARVTVRASRSADCSPSLGEAAAVGSATCTVSGETVFTIIAELGGESVEDSASVILEGAGAPDLFIANRWAFDGERISLIMSVLESARAHMDAIENILVNGEPMQSSQVAAIKSGETVEVEDVLVTPLGVPVQMIYGGGLTRAYEPVEVVNLSFDARDYDVKEVSSIVFDDNLNRYTGVMLTALEKKEDGKLLGVARFYKNGGSIEFNFLNSITNAYDMGGMWNKAFFQKVEKYPVVVALRKGNAEDIFAGVTGAIMRSKDGGENWENIMVTRRRAHLSYPDGDGSHPTCGRNEVQPGVRPHFEGDFVSLNRICDIIVKEDGRVFAATDFGVKVEENIDDSEIKWLGTPPVGKTGPEVGALTFGHVTHDIELVGDRVFAAADHGVFVSADGGIRWERFGDMPGPAYALAYDARNQAIYAGTEQGLYSSSSESAAWAEAGVREPVVDVAIDPSAPLGTTTIIAGTAEGDGQGAIQVSRDGGAKWSRLSLANLDNAGEINTIALVAKPTVTAVSSGVTYGIAIGTSSGGELFTQTQVVRAQTISAAMGSNFRGASLR